MLAEVDRLEQVYSRYNVNSELNLFLLAPVGQAVFVSDDFRYLLEQSLVWTRRTRGAFHPGTDIFSELWRQAEVIGTLPETLEQFLPYFQEPFCRLESKHAIKQFPFTLNSNAIAKGLIVDKALFAASMIADDVCLSIGGDLAQVGSKPVRVAVEEKAIDNAKPACFLEVQNRAVASSGASRRGFTVAGKHYSHIIDPRSGQSVQNNFSVTVIAADCSSADVMATTTCASRWLGNTAPTSSSVKK